MHVQLHPVFESPSDPNIPIWRYMDLAKFVSLLGDEALHFARADVMSDEFEGSITTPTFELRQSLPSGRVDKLHFGMVTRLAIRRYTYLNCWHMNWQESAAMWALYTSGEPQGIAIRSTYQRLSESITDERIVYIGTVDYLNYGTDVMPDEGAFYPYVHKRKSFEHENELRAVYRDNGWTQATIDGQPEDRVVPIAVDLNRLVEGITVSPKAQTWFARIVGEIVTRYGRSWPVQHSNLDGNPLY